MNSKTSNTHLPGAWRGLVFQMIALDRTPDAIQEAVYRRIGPAGRFRIAVELSNVVHALAETGIRMRHPEYTSEEVAGALIWQLYGLRAERLED